MTEVQFPTALLSRYSNPCFLGAGGASNVFSAHDTNLNKQVAIKLLSPDSSSQQLLRFQQEAKVVSKLTHPNIVTAIDFGVVENRPYLVLELTGTRSLAALVRNGESISLDQAIRIFEQICSAMQHAHGQGILHRDLKPANVLMEEINDGPLVAKVADFGIAKLTGTSFQLTTGNIFIGTPAYASPEQFMVQEVDERSDVYSFGCLMFEVLAGQTPYSAELVTELAALHSKAPIPELESTASGESLPDHLQSLIQRCLAKSQDARPSGFAEISEILGHLRDDQANAKRTDSKGQSFRQPYLVPEPRQQQESRSVRHVLLFISILVVACAGAICLSLVGFADFFSTALPAPPKANVTKYSASNSSVKSVEETTTPLPRKTIPMPGTVNLSEKAKIKKAKIWLKERKYESVLNCTDDILKQNPGNYTALLLRSEALTAMDNYNDALQDIVTALNLSPKDKTLLERRKDLHKKISDFNSALEDLDALVKEFPENESYRRERKEVLERLENSFK